MTIAQAFNDNQQAHWNGGEGEYWTVQQERLDHMLAPIIVPLLEFAAPKAGSTILDVGCGCGATTIELARLAGADGRVIGVDISKPMLARAAQRLQEFGNSECRLGDAAELPLQDLKAELIFSRFGVMFFGDPVAAFTNLRRGLQPGGRLRFACWRPIHENPWLHLPIKAVFEHVPPPPKPEPDEPGPFAFSDTARVTRILTEAGFTAPTFTPLDIHVDISGAGSLEEAALQSTQMGPAKRALSSQSEEVRAAAIGSISRALAPYATTAGVILPAAIWLVAAGG